MIREFEGRIQTKDVCGKGAEALEQETGSDRRMEKTA
jgi:hypothetical protein